MVLSAVVNRPTSVSGLAAGSRADKSPAAIASAVSSTCSNGFKPRAIIHLEAKAIASNAITPKVKNKKRSLFKVLSTSSSEFATMTVPMPVGKTCARALTSGPPLSPSMVNGLFLYLATSEVFIPVTAKLFPPNSPPTWPIRFPSISSKVTEVAVGTPLNGANILKGESF